MKKMMMAVAVVLMSVAAGVANAQSVNEQTQLPYEIRFDQLSAYLELTPDQSNDVFEITNLFMKEQTAGMKSKKNREDKMEKAVYGNLKMMKSALTADQYRKYVALINQTTNNRRTAEADTYLADRK